MAPFDLSTLSGTVSSALVFGAIGFGFGAVLEMGGFGDTRKLAGQFYLKDMTVLKVMFTAIIVAAVLVAGATGLGLLDMSRVWVNPTYLWPGIVGGLIMGVGFVLGGFCPGTSVVASATLKIDGMVFLLGALIGVWLFGETVGSYEAFFISSNLGRFTLPEWLGLPVGATVLLVVAGALLLFWAGDLAEQVFGRGRRWAEVTLRPVRAHLAAAGVLVLAAVAVMARGQPTLAEKFALLGAEVRRPVEERGLFVHPAEVVALKKDVNLQVNILDLRSEHDFNLFHLGGARRVEAGALLRSDRLKDLLALPASAVTFLVANGEGRELEVWKELRAAGVNNLYAVEGGIDHWLELYGVPACVAERAGAVPPEGPDISAWRFAYATGSRLPAAAPDLPASRARHVPCQDPASATGGHAGEHGSAWPAYATGARLPPPAPDLPASRARHVPCQDPASATGGHAGEHGSAWPAYAFTRKVKLKSKAAVKGGCG